MGKTSLLARGLQQARSQGVRVVLTDFQELNSSDFASLEKFYFALGDSLADQLELDVSLGDVWDEQRSPNTNFDRYLRRSALENLNVHVVWGLDEVDRLFTCNFGGEVFGMFRSWHNKRALEYISTGQVPVKDLITVHLPLERALDAFDIVAKGEAIKVTVEP